MNYVKIVSKGWAGYTGQLNIISFRDGVSTEPVPKTILDRIAAVTQLVACDAEGNEINEGEQLGIQNRMIGGVTLRAEVREPLARLTDEEKNMEALVDADKALAAPVDKLYTTAELEAIASEKGIKGLREIGAKWKVTGKSFPQLIQGILVAQTNFLALRQKAVEAKGTSTGKLKTAADEEAEAVQKQLEEEAAAPLGYEGLAVEYYLDDKVIPGETLINAALKNTGKSLTGWNNLLDHERKAFIEAEIEAIEAHFGQSLTTEFTVEEVKTDVPAADVAGADSDGDDAVDESEADETPADASEPSSDEAESEGSEDATDQPAADEDK